MTQPPLVLHVINRNQHRGAENVAGYLHDALVEAGFRSRIVALEDSVDDRRADVGVALRTSREVPHLTGWWRLRRQIRQERPVVVLAHGFLSALAATVATLGCGEGRPRIVWHRILRLPRSPRHPAYLAHRLVARRCDAAICITPYLCDETRALGHRGRIELVPNHRPAGAADGDRALPPGLGSPYVLFLGRLVDQKRPDRFVRVAESIARSGAECQFVMAGMGPLRAEVDAQVDASSDLAGRVVMLGHVDDPTSLLRGAACLLLTSDNESSPGVVVEALLQGCPVITLPVDGVEELLDGAPSVIVRTSSEADLARAVTEELDHPTPSEERENTRTRAQALTTERVLATYLAVLGLELGAASTASLVLVIPNVGVGGLERGTMSLARAAQSSGIPVKVITLTDPRVAGASFIEEASANGIEVESLGLAGLGTYRRPVRLARATRRLRRALPASRDTVVASAILDADLPARLAARSRRLRHVSHLVNTTYADAVRPAGPMGRVTFGVARLVERLSSSLTDQYLALTDAVAAYAVADLGIPKHKLAVIGRGVDLSRFAPEGRTDSTRIRVVSLGRLVRQKNHACTLRAAAMLDANRFHVQIFGEGPLEAALVELREQLGLPVDALGGVTSNPEAVLSGADVYVSVSLWEGQSNAVVEAMAAGCILVLADIPVLREVGGTVATYVDPHAPEQLAAALQRIATLGSAEVDTLRSRTRQRAVNSFDEDTLAHRAVDVMVARTA